ncbi:RsmB/NOP family class I SAM-dependent RNA methyltransferase [Marivita sp. GX14005]|uniref:RsmB/NOP family class I SAM-dependent RNA methyltransferase n=1 Tax=Marivita sp. GX14005 TaxID=2942276 RepID=UPI0020187FD2|nr:RsmB/NOP family class I SAM-dependent RNA methyltransferase [Marivita sp. GX14005]MCL3883739.1 RsmB/NOP family class I SAM-dependent RNA methyltransferase [Marivita sp. GX14005]
MTPAARWAAAAENLDRIRGGTPAEKALINWARASRFAGSKDRAAVRDHVFDILRCLRSAAALGGGDDGRRMVLGRLRQTGIDPDIIFTGQGYAMAPLTEAERHGGHAPSGAESRDLPDWLDAHFARTLGAEAAPVAEALRHRAAVFLRVNTAKATPETARLALEDAGIETAPHDLSPTALEVLSNPRRVQQSPPFLNGLVELQDAASQAVVDALPLEQGMRVLDYCAGGGGKALAMAARLHGPVEAHDIDRGRMADLPARAERAGAAITRVDAPRGTYDLVLCDVPCSGSGAWRRSPEGKWRLTPEGLAELQQRQASILDAAAALVGQNGVLAYATCSVLPDENDHQIDAFLAARSDWVCLKQHRFLPHQGNDGFFVAILARGGTQ